MEYSKIKLILEKENKWKKKKRRSDGRRESVNILQDFTRRDLNNFIIRFYITTPFWGLLLKYNVI